MCPVPGRLTPPNPALKRTGHSPRFLSRVGRCPVARRLPRPLDCPPQQWPGGARYAGPQRHAAKAVASRWRPGHHPSRRSTRLLLAGGVGAWGARAAWTGVAQSNPALKLTGHSPRFVSGAGRCPVARSLPRPLGACGAGSPSAPCEERAGAGVVCGWPPAAKAEGSARHRLPAGTRGRAPRRGGWPAALQGGTPGVQGSSHRTLHWSCQGKPKTLELGAIPGNWLLLPSGCEPVWPKSHLMNA